MEKLRIIKGYEDRYAISASGEVYSYKAKRNLIGGINGWGYRQVLLCKNCKYKVVRIHRLVAEYFIPNPNNSPCVNYKDGNKLNNNVDNLEWCTYSENTLHAFRIGLKNSKYLRPGARRPVIGKNKNTGKIIEFESLTAACKKLGINFGSLGNVLKGIRRSAKGYTWQYKN